MSQAGICADGEGGTASAGGTELRAASLLVRVRVLLGDHVPVQGAILDKRPEIQKIRAVLN